MMVDENEVNMPLVRIFPNLRRKESPLLFVYIMLCVAILCLFVIVYCLLKTFAIDVQGQSNEHIIRNINNIMRKEINQDRYFLADKKAVFGCGIGAVIFTMIVVNIFCSPDN